MREKETGKKNRGSEKREREGKEKRVRVGEEKVKE